MSGPGIPFYLAPIQPHRVIRLRANIDACPPDPGDEVYERIIWGYAVPEGWRGWISKAHMTTQPPITWLKGLWEEACGAVPMATASKDDDVE
jgi:hypothetical protein